MAFINLYIKHSIGSFTLMGRCDIKSRITGVFGPSGAGKTRLLQLLAGLEKPQEGFLQINKKVYLDTESDIFIPAHKRRIGYVFQEGRVFPHMNVEANLKYGWKKNTHNNTYFGEIVDLLELRPLLKSRTEHLSGGQNQRVAFGRALMSNAQLLLLDEPFTSLDPSIKKQVISLLNRVINRLDIPVIIVSHELKDLLMLTENLLLIKDGIIEQPDSYLELIRKRKLLDFNGTINNYYNVFNGIITETIPEKGLTKVQLIDEKNLLINIESDIQFFHPGGSVKISIRGTDVALSLNYVEMISIRNQFQGHIKTIFQHHNHLICIIDCGIQIITRVTLDSGKSLDLKPGKKVWCLFKSLAVEVYK